MAALRCGHDALGAREEKPCLERFELRYVHAVHHAVLDELRDDDSGTVVAQTARVYVGRLEVVSECEHWQQRSVASLVAVVVAELSACELGTARRLGCDVFCLASFEDGVAHEWEGDASEVASASEACYHHVGIFARHLHLFLRLKTYDGLMESHMVEHRAERILAVGRCGGKLYGFGYGCSERAGVVRVACDDVLSGACRHGRRAGDVGSERAHEYSPVGLLLECYLHLIDGSLESEHLCGVAQSRAPLSGARLGGDIGDALLTAVVALRQGGVYLV